MPRPFLRRDRPDSRDSALPAADGTRPRGHWHHLVGTVAIAVGGVAFASFLGWWQVNSPGLFGGRGDISMSSLQDALHGRWLTNSYVPYAVSAWLIARRSRPLVTLSIVAPTLLAMDRANLYAILHGKSNTAFLVTDFEWTGLWPFALIAAGAVAASAAVAGLRTLQRAVGAAAVGSSVLALAAVTLIDDADPIVAAVIAVAAIGLLWLDHRAIRTHPYVAVATLAATALVTFAIFGIPAELWTQPRQPIGG